MIVRRLARLMLGAAAVADGLAAIRDPEPRVAAVRRFGVTDPETVARLDAGVQVGAGALLVLGRLPRLAALLASVSLLPATVGANRFWAEPDRQARDRAFSRLVADVGLVGGMLLAAVDGRRRRRAAKLPGSG